MTTFILTDWTYWDNAAFQLGVHIGLWPSLDKMADHKEVFWTNNLLGVSLNTILETLVSEGILERRDEPDVQYRSRP